MARQYSLPSETTGKRDRSDPRGLSGYIRETAKKYGIDPEVALRVAKSEGLKGFKSGVIQKSGKEEPSWGAFQLYTGGGLGNKFQKETGLDPSDPANEKATIDYALKTAAKTGWGPWHGAKNTGIGEWEGIGGGTKTASVDAAPVPTGQGGVGSDAAASERAARVDTTAPDVAQTTPQLPVTGDFLDKLKDPKGNVATGLGEAITGLGQAVTGSGKGLYDTTSARPTVPIAPTPAPAQVAPMVDPRQAEQQRQQLAMAMQKLNSGRLY